MVIKSFQQYAELLPKITLVEPMDFLKCIRRLTMAIRWTIQNLLMVNRGNGAYIVGILWTQYFSRKIYG